VPPTALGPAVALWGALGRTEMGRGLGPQTGQAAPRERLAQAPPTALGPAVALRETPRRAAVARTSAAVRREWPGREFKGGGAAGQVVLGLEAQVLLQGVRWAT